MAAAGVLFWVAPRPPQAAEPSADEAAAMQRGTDFVVRDAKAWQRDHGDRALPWDEAQGHLAIVIDDVGRELHVLEKLLSLRFRLTFAILPGSVYASGAQLRLQGDRRRYREILLHLPMEPLQSEQMFGEDERQETFLLQTDDDEALRAKTAAALARVPAAIGVNNHMGSKLSADRRVMDAVMPELKARELFFLDSRTTADTQAAFAAEAAGVPQLSRQVFLDNEVEPQAIVAQLREAAALSKRGPTVAIGHPSVELYQVLAEQLPALLDEGIAVYPLSHVLEHQVADSSDSAASR